MNEIEHIPKCPKNGEVNLLYLIEIIKKQYGIFRERFRGHYLGSIPK